MAEVLITLLIFGIIIILLFKAIGNLVKGLIFLFFALLAYYFLSSYIPSQNFPIQTIGNFLNVPIEKIRNTLYNLEIVTVTPSGNSLIIVVKNNGFLPLTNFDVEIDGKNAMINNNISILIPKQVGVIEVEWKGKYSRIEVFTKQTKAIYFSPL